MIERTSNNPTNRTQDQLFKIARIDQAIFESEKEMEEGGIYTALDEAFAELNKKYSSFLQK